jgi:hypothetical protein
MVVPIIAGAATEKTAETAAAASVQAANMGVQAAASGASSGGITSGASISGTPPGGSLGKSLDTLINAEGSGINSSPLGGLQSGANKGLTGNTGSIGNAGSTQKSPTLYEKMKNHGPRIKSAINKTKKANEMRKGVHEFGKDMMGQDAHRNDPEQAAPRVHNKYRRL